MATWRKPASVSAGASFHFARMTTTVDEDGFAKVQNVCGRWDNSENQLLQRLENTVDVSKTKAATTSSNRFTFYRWVSTGQIAH